MKKNKGITLIALVITIIILLILAGVTIAMLTGENGILVKANSAQTANTIGREKEEISIAYNSAKIEKSKNGDLSQVKGEELNSSLMKDNLNATASGDNPIVIKFNSTNNKYEIDSNGKIQGPKTEETEEIEKVESTSSLWEFDVATQTIQQYLGSDIATITEIIIPNYIDKVQVKKIDSFYGDLYIDEKLKKIIISEGIQEIGSNAFSSLNDLEEVQFPKNLKVIRREAFYNSNSLKYVELKEGLEIIEEVAFGATGIEKITLPQSLKELGGLSFMTNEPIKITSLNTGNGTYFYKDSDDYGDSVITNGEIYFPDNVVARTCGRLYLDSDLQEELIGDDAGLIWFRLNKETKEAEAFLSGNMGGSGIFGLPRTINGYKVVKMSKDLLLKSTTVLSFANTLKLIELGSFNTEDNYYTNVILFYGYNSLAELKELKIEEGAFPPMPVCLENFKDQGFENPVFSREEFLSYCTIISETH